MKYGLPWFNHFLGFMSCLTVLLNVNFYSGHATLVGIYQGEDLGSVFSDVSLEFSVNFYSGRATLVGKYQGEDLGSVFSDVSLEFSFKF
ncbi:unnamed protein product [Rhizophagus irregularis]|nr:unnamed protein product [Rhizophagus irregularis]